jgi:hypothetical protein
MESYPTIDGSNAVAGRRYVDVDVLREAVLEAKDEFTLCDPGVRHFFEAFGMKATQTYVLEVTLRRPLRIEVEVPFGTDPDDYLPEGELDTLVDNHLTNQLLEIPGVDSCPPFTVDHSFAWAFQSDNPPASIEDQAPIVIGAA